MLSTFCEQYCHGQTDAKPIYPSESILSERMEPIVSSQERDGGDRKLNEHQASMTKLAVGTFDQKVKACESGDVSALWVLCRDEEPYIRFLVAKHPIRGILNLLREDESLDVRVEVAKHGILELLEHLQHDSNFRVRKEVATHNYPHILKRLARDPKASVRKEVAKHPNRAILKSLLKDEMRYVVSEAKNTLGIMNV